MINRQDCGISALLLFICMVSLVFAEQPSEKLTITTYYPSPTGIYNKLQSRRFSVGDTNDDGNINANDLPEYDGQLLVNRSVMVRPLREPPADGREGEIFYNLSAHSFYFHNGTDWVPMGTLTEEYLYNRVHTFKECTDQGGVVVPSDGTAKICRMSRDACPSLWSQYKSFSQTVAKTCTRELCAAGCSGLSPVPSNPASCTTSFHAWQDKARESCGYYTCVSCQLVDVNCYATIQEVGCY